MYKIIFVQILLIVLSTTWVLCTISGVSYMDSFNFTSLKKQLAGEDPCNPLYWYPKNIPEYCYYNSTKPKTKPNPIPLPIPVPLPPQPFPISIPMAPSYPMPLPYPMPPTMAMPSLPLRMPVYPPVPLPYGVPMVPTNPMIPVAGVPFPYPLQFYRPRQQAGMVPGIPGLVSPDGGINILPFSDAYADMLENHRNKLIRKKFGNVFDDYNDYPRKRRRHRHRKH